MLRVGLRLMGLLCVALTMLLVAAVPASASGTDASSVPRYDHVFLMVEENHGLTDIIGNKAAPNLNALASQFGLATNYFAVAHPSEPNYIALMGGSTFGIASDDAYYVNAINRPNLVTQLDGAGVSWKGYFQSMPHAGYQGICFPSKCNGSPDSDPLYVAKHDAIQNFSPALNAADWSRQMPIEQLSADVRSGAVPAFNYVVPDECHDMHGDPPYCIDSGTPGDPQDQRLVSVGDQYAGNLVSTITNAPFWAKGNNAIEIAFDEGDDNASGGGQVASIVVTSHGPRGLRDATPASHYSTLQTIQSTFGVGCLENTCDTAHVKPLSALFAVTGSAAVATQPLPIPDLPTPTPTPSEPALSTSKTVSSGGWTVVPSPLWGTNDNSLGAVAAAGPNDVWAVGDFLPDAAGANRDATLSLAAHYDGHAWTATPTPNVGPNYDTLFGVAASGGKAWTVGVHLDAAYHVRGLIEAWDGTKWNVVDTPATGAASDLLFGASATSPTDVWAIGEQQGKDGRFGTLVEHFDGRAWSVVPSPNPSPVGDHLYAVTAAGPNDVWAVGQQLGDGTTPDRPLVEHWDGHGWSAVAPPTPGNTSASLFGVAAGAGGVWAVGETDDPVQGARPLVEQLRGDAWSPVSLPQVGSKWTSLWGVTVAEGTVWAVGTYLDLATDNNVTLTLRGGSDGWSAVNGPNPGSGSNILGGIAAAGGTLWAAGVYDDGGSRQTLLERSMAQ